MSDVALPLPGSAPVTPYKLFLLIFAIYATCAAINFSLVGSKTEEKKCDTRSGPFSSGFNAGFQTGSCTCNRYFSFAEACPSPATLLPLDFTTGL